MFMRSHWNVGNPIRISRCAAFTALFSLGALLFCGVDAAAEEPKSVQPPNSEAISNNVDQDEAKFRDLVIDVATDLRSPVHDHAVGVIFEQSIVSDRFNDPIRRAIRQVQIDDQNFEALLRAAVSLLPASTIPQREQTSILLDALVLLSQQDNAFGRQLKSGLMIDGPRESVAVNSIILQLSAAPESLVKVLEGRFQQGDQPAVIYSTVPLASSEGASLIPYLLKAGETNDPFVKAAVFISLRKTFTTAEIASVTQMKKKFRADTEKIFIRSDVDQNLVLTPNEWSKMLVNPAAADINGDGKITPDEYNDWFVQRKIGQMRVAPR